MIHIAASSALSSEQHMIRTNLNMNLTGRGGQVPSHTRSRNNINIDNRDSVRARLFHNENDGHYGTRSHYHSHQDPLSLRSDIEERRDEAFGNHVADVNADARGEEQLDGRSDGKFMEL